MVVRIWVCRRVKTWQEGIWDGAGGVLQGMITQRKLYELWQIVGPRERARLHGVRLSQSSF